MTKRGLRDVGYRSLIRMALDSAPKRAPKVIYLSKLGLSEDQCFEVERIVQAYAEACHGGKPFYMFRWLPTEGDLRNLQ